MTETSRRQFLASTSALLVAPLAAEAQQRPLPRVGFLADGAGNLLDSSHKAFEDGLREHGFVPGTNVVIERRFAAARMERHADHAAELVGLGVDVIVAPSERAAVAARQATTAIPIVMVLGVEPVRRGLIQSFARPGGNVTGLTVDPGPDIIAKRLQLLREVVPGVRTIALLTEPTGDTSRLGPLDAAAKAAGVSLVRVEVRRSDDLVAAFATINTARAEAILVSGAAVLYLLRSDVTALTMKSRLPAMYPLGAYAEAGGLIAYGVDMLDLFRRAGGYVARILNGAKPADLPVEQPTKFELVINLKTAKALGLTIPPSLLLRADQVIE